MPITVSPDGNLFSLETARTLYQMTVDGAGVLQHVYYGPKTGEDMRYLIRRADRGFSGNPYEQQEDRAYSLDTLPQEYATCGVGDYRTPALAAERENGSLTADWRFSRFQLLRGKTSLAGLPCARGDQETAGLEIVLRDEASGLEAALSWFLFEDADVITRSVRITNGGKSPVTLRKAATLTLDFPAGEWEAIHFHGRHAMERMAERLPVPAGGSLRFESRRGMSSHHSNPFLILCGKETTERSGSCWGCMLIYSGNHLEEAGLDQTGSLRLTCGLQPEGFAWRLAPGERFQTPEAALAFAPDGLNALSRAFHRLIREQILPRQWRERPRPVLLNSWEASYFDFTAESILRLGRNARELGAEMLVLDDGWFGKRNDDTTSLGDWIPNEEKLGCSLRELSERIHEEGLAFGLWIEPEMISEDSDLYRAHPEWVLREPDRKPAVGRRQLLLDMGREDVGEALFESIAGLLRTVRIEYLKWDFNRSAANCWSGVLPPERQGEAAHRFMLGTYRLLERLTEAFPDVMIEGCAGGGGRFDAGMLYYTPQIWCSDDTDAVERLEIQRGTSYGYPPCAMGAHVSASPNHQTGRKTPMKTRGVTAAAGTFGYELDPEKLTAEEKEEVRRQIAEYHRDERLVREGDYYRLTELGGRRDWEAWMFVSPDRETARVSFVMTHVRANGPFPTVRLEGLDEEAVYLAEETGKTYTGAALMYGGYSFGQGWGDYPAEQVHLRRQKSREA